MLVEALRYNLEGCVWVTVGVISDGIIGIFH
jgi:hypothetical protein